MTVNAVCRFKVVGDLPFIHVSETELLNRLCRLATHYLKFQNFLQLHRHRPLAGLIIVYLIMCLLMIGDR